MRIMIVDDHAIVRAGLASSLASTADFVIAGQAASAKEATSLIRVCKPDVALVDLSLPDLDGIELIKVIRRIRPECQCIVFTVRSGGYDVNRALEAGAHAYLFKDTSLDELVAAIRLVAQGGHYIPPAVGRRVSEVKSNFELTPREREVLIYLARGLSTRKICSALGISEDTVKSHTRNILGKLGLDTRSEVVAHCLRHGLVQIENI